MMKKPMAKKSIGMKKSAKKAAPMMKAGGKMMKAKFGTTTTDKTTKSPMQIYKQQYPDADTSALGDTRFGDEINAYGPKKVLDRIAAGDKAFDAKYGKGKPAVDKVKVKPTKMKVKAKTGAKMAKKKMTMGGMMKKGGKMSKKAC